MIYSYHEENYSSMRILTKKLVTRKTNQSPFGICQLSEGVETHGLNVFLNSSWVISVSCILSLYNHKLSIVYTNTIAALYPGHKPGRKGFTVDFYKGSARLWTRNFWCNLMSSKNFTLKLIHVNQFKSIKTKHVIVGLVHREFHNWIWSQVSISLQ